MLKSHLNSLFCLVTFLNPGCPRRSRQGRKKNKTIKSSVLLWSDQNMTWPVWVCQEERGRATHAAAAAALQSATNTGINKTFQSSSSCMTAGQTGHTTAAAAAAAAAATRLSDYVYRQSIIWQKIVIQFSCQIRRRATTKPSVFDSKLRTVHSRCVRVRKTDCGRRFAKPPVTSGPSGKTMTHLVVILRWLIEVESKRL